MTKQQEITRILKVIKTQKCSCPSGISQEILVAQHKFLVAPGRRAGDFASPDYSMRTRYPQAKN